MRYARCWLLFFFTLALNEETPGPSAREAMMRRLKLDEWEPEQKMCPPQANVSDIGSCISNADTCAVNTQMREDARRQNIDRVLCLAWNYSAGYKLTADEEAQILLASMPAEIPIKKICRAAAYGEVTTSSARIIAASMGLSNPRENPEIVFMDLGSGVGKFVIHAFLEWPAIVEASGVELSVSRSNEAQQAWNWVWTEGHAVQLRGTARHASTHSDSVRFVQGDFFHADVGNVTHMYISSLCFNDGMLNKISQKLGREAARLQVIVSLRDFPSGVVGFKMDGRMDIEMSWTQAFGTRPPAFLYRRHSPTT